MIISDAQQYVRKYICAEEPFYYSQDIKEKEPDFTFKELMKLILDYEEKEKTVTSAEIMKKMKNMIPSYDNSERFRKLLEISTSDGVSENMIHRLGTVITNLVEDIGKTKNLKRNLVTQSKLYEQGD